MSPAVAIQLVGSLLAPAFCLWLVRRLPILTALGPMVMAYLFGIILGNIIPDSIHGELASTLCGIAVLLAIPLLLFLVDVRQWVSLARDSLIGSVVVFAVVPGLTVAAAIVFAPHAPHFDQIAGMVTGLFTGGTVNMVAVATALQVSPELQVIMNAADMTVCGLYLFLLLSVGYRVFLSLNPRDPDHVGLGNIAEVGDTNSREGLGQAAALALAVAAIGALAREITPDPWKDTSAILTVTTLGILGSELPRVRSWRGAEFLGEYLLLIFGFSMGLLARLDKLGGAEALLYMGYMAVVLLAVVLVHGAICWVLKVDGATIAITSAAGIYGPAFVAPVARRLGRPELIVPGIACGLMGVAGGTYAGILIGTLLRGWLGAS